MRDLAAQALLPVDTALAVALFALLLVATATAAVFRLAPDGSRGRAREILLAGVRATVQLGAVSLVIGRVAHHTAALYAFLLLMFGVAARTAGRRITRNGTWWWAALPVAGPVIPVVAGLTAAGLLPVRGIAMIPVTGILIGGALTATVLSGRRALDELHTRYGEFEAGLALGLADHDARMEVVRPAASDALLPGLDQTRTVGLVTLPGAFVGMLLGGASPVLAGAVQLFVLIALLAVQAVAVAVTVELIARGRLHREGTGLAKTRTGRA
ncbi:ABC transporter permease [Streptomyces alfalfae]|uniref:ABC transporter permease n=1 Tax=Streptomyces alfalfae TaxID=1642299 RepID=A0ABM6GNS6_9ACTN|nr:ABC transporter permease [Streptomyces alfalfae]APY84910.1 ABC transporter permease [Streptomyces alfalfae]RXX35003.1 ABC transporter permease [Streptomyces alfalfae]RXX45789.1 ABC transporter permease [Streptomyces alfalfae]RXX47924.1 ABC transporter permease [Streptomyces alfalfae]RZN01722.1 ABC transporter permease [Streptomyces alfalfae]